MVDPVKVNQIRRVLENSISDNLYPENGVLSVIFYETGMSVWTTKYFANLRTGVTGKILKQVMFPPSPTWPYTDI
jgi:hypothetical protein